MKLVVTIGLLLTTCATSLQICERPDLCIKFEHDDISSCGPGIGSGPAGEVAASAEVTGARQSYLLATTTTELNKTYPLPGHAYQTVLLVRALPGHGAADIDNILSIATVSTHPASLLCFDMILYCTLFVFWAFPHWAIPVCMYSVCGNINQDLGVAGVIVAGDNIKRGSSHVSTVPAVLVSLDAGSQILYLSKIVEGGKVCTQYITHYCICMSLKEF